MIVVIFEVLPKPGKKSEYLDIAKALKPELIKIPGFISIERFQSLQNPDKILSLSVWENEQAVEQWRNTEKHRFSQKKGRDYIFEDYRLMVTSVNRDYGMKHRAQVPNDSQTYHDS